MTLDLEKYTWTDGQTDLSAAELNPRFYAIIRRLHALEQLSIDWDEAISEVQNYGLERINNAVLPLIESLQTDLAALVAQGKADLTSQSASVDVKITEIETTIAAQVASVTAKLAECDAWLTSAKATVANAVDTLRPRWKLLSTDTVSVEPYQQYVVRGGLLDIAGLMSLSADAQLLVEVN